LDEFSSPLLIHYIIACENTKSASQRDVNMLAFLLHSAASPKFLKDAQQRKQGNTEQDKAVYFDILVLQ